MLALELYPNPCPGRMDKRQRELGFGFIRFSFVYISSLVIIV